MKWPRRSEMKRGGAGRTDSVRNEQRVALQPNKLGHLLRPDQRKGVDIDNYLVFLMTLGEIAIFSKPD